MGTTPGLASASYFTWYILLMYNSSCEVRLEHFIPLSTPCWKQGKTLADRLILAPSTLLIVFICSHPSIAIHPPTFEL